MHIPSNCHSFSKYFNLVKTEQREWWQRFDLIASVSSVKLFRNVLKYSIT